MQMEMGEQPYGLSDLRQLLAAGPPHFPAVAHPFAAPSSHHFEMVMTGEPVPSLQRGDFRSDSCSAALDESGLWDGGNGRWPRQETLTLLDIRSRLDSRFKEANHKGPLWDEVARIMAEEHGYHRSGKKCREKFENLYKYYKKTKEGKAGRQDGKHYRFFRQLEALYGENTHQVAETNLYPHATNLCTTHEGLQAHQKFSGSLSLSNSSEFETSSSGDANTPACTENDSSISNKKDPKGVKRGRRSWKSKIREFIDLQMKKFMEMQEAWLEKMLTTLEMKEQERMCREEEWRKQEAERFDREHRFWAKERAWVQARDIALMEALQKICGRELRVPSPEEPRGLNLHEDPENEMGNESDNKRWPEPEILSLMKIRNSMELRFQEGGCSMTALWEEISAKMGCLGYNRTGKRCKEKWESINKYFKRDKDCNKKRKENSRTPATYINHFESIYSEGGGSGAHESDEQGQQAIALQTREVDGPSASNSLAGPVLNDQCLHFLMGEGVNLWENYGLKLNKGQNH